MKFRQIVPDFSVSGEMTAADIAEAARQGFRACVNNRPDGEAPGQTPAADLRAEAGRHGLAFLDLPFSSGGLTRGHVAALAEALETLPKPVLAFCRTGTRSTNLWALAQAGRMPADAIVAAGRQAGYDLEGLRPYLEAKA